VTDQAEANRPAVSVVVATRNRACRLARLLESLAEQSLPRERFELILVDDASTDSTQQTIEGARREHALEARVIRRKACGGPSAARNDGWREARAPLIAFIDDDCVALPGWLAAGSEAAGDPPMAIVQGRTTPDPREDHLIGPFARTLSVEQQGPYYQACNIFYPREVLEQLEGFDANAFPHVGEDTDLAWRSIENGHEIRFAPAAGVHHAVAHLGPLGTLRIAARWTPSIRLFRRHPRLRPVHLYRGVFWKDSHYHLVKALVALLLPRRLRPLALVLGGPYVLHLLERTRREGGGPPAMPYYALYDLVELAAVARGAARYRTVVL
jgi:glycosyltransferase involved in cell wall biosynthesis